MEKRTIIKQATSVGEPPEYTYTVMPDGKIFDTKQEAKDYIYNKRPRWYWKTAQDKAGRKRETAVKQYLAKIKLAQCVNFQRETLDIPKDFIADVIALVCCKISRQYLFSTIIFSTPLS